MHEHTHPCISMQTHIYTHAHVHTHMQTWVIEEDSLCQPKVSIFMSILIHTHTNIHTFKHTCTHMQIWTIEKNSLYQPKVSTCMGILISAYTYICPQTTAHSQVAAHRVTVQSHSARQDYLPQEIRHVTLPTKPIFSFTQSSIRWSTDKSPITLRCCCKD